jgi:hypothetical protein
LALVVPALRNFAVTGSDRPRATAR